MTHGYFDQCGPASTLLLWVLSYDAKVKVAFVFLDHPT